MHQPKSVVNLTNSDEKTIKMKECESIVKKALAENRVTLQPDEAQRICAIHQIPTPAYGVAANVAEAVEKAKKIGYPVALKIISPQIIHKSDVGGVVVNIANEKELKVEYEKMIAEVRRKEPAATIQGVLVEQMIAPGTEVIVGATRDDQFGPALMFGIGGIFAELYDDVKFRVAPIDRLDALNMIHGLRGSKILEGARGQAPVDVDSIVNILMRVSDIMMEHDQVKQIDLNPVIVNPKGAYAVDSRIIITGRSDD